MDRVAVAKELVRTAKELDERYEETGDEKFLRLSNACTQTLKEVVAEHRAMQKQAQWQPGAKATPNSMLPITQGLGNQNTPQQNARKRIYNIDAEIFNLKSQLLQKMQEKGQLMQEAGNYSPEYQQQINQMATDVRNTSGVASDSRVNTGLVSKDQSHNLNRY